MRVKKNVEAHPQRYHILLSVRSEENPTHEQMFIHFLQTHKLILTLLFVFWHNGFEKKKKLSSHFSHSLCLICVVVHQRCISFRSESSVRLEKKQGRLIIIAASLSIYSRLQACYVSVCQFNNNDKMYVFICHNFKLWMLFSLFLVRKCTPYMVGARTRNGNNHKLNRVKIIL